MKAVSLMGPGTIVSSPRYVDVGGVRTKKAEGMTGMPTQLTATSITKRWRSSLLGYGCCREFDAALDDAIVGVMEESGSSKILGTRGSSVFLPTVYASKGCTCSKLSSMLLHYYSFSSQDDPTERVYSRKKNPDGCSNGMGTEGRIFSIAKLDTAVAFVSLVSE